MLVPRGGGAFLNEMDGNLTCRRDEQTCIAEIHWVGKIRGAEFNPDLASTRNDGLEKLKDSEGRLIKTVVAKPTLDVRCRTHQGIGNESLDRLLMLLDTKPGLTQVEMAEESDGPCTTASPTR